MKQLTFEFIKTHKILNRTYTIKNLQDQKLPRQAKICICIMVDACGDTQSCTEAQLRAKVAERAEELKTRQDPWRIFQYYRPMLVKAGVIAHN